MLNSESPFLDQAEVFFFHRGGVRSHPKGIRDDLIQGDRASAGMAFFGTAPSGRSASSSTRFMTPTVRRLPQTGQRLVASRVSLRRKENFAVPVPVVMVFSLFGKKFDGVENLSGVFLADGLGDGPVTQLAVKNVRLPGRSCPGNGRRSWRSG